jgi:ankyrin repeat protein
LDDEPLLEWLLAHDVDINAKSDRWNSTALDLAAEARPLPVVKRLIQHGASTAHANPLHSAASSEKDRREILDYLLGLGLDISGMSSFGSRVNKRTGDEDRTPLHAAIRAGNPLHMNFLLDRGADPRAKTIMGYTALEYAIYQGFDAWREVLESRHQAEDR